jgi:tetratricopeptide (TPR) repeat protein
MRPAFAPRIGSLACALFAYVAACHPRPGPHGSTFTRVATPHFNVYTDVSPRSAEAHARKLEWLLQGLLQIGWEHHGELPLKLNVVLLRDRAELQQFTGFDIAGFFNDDVLFEPWAVLAAPVMTHDLSTLVHELSHHLAYLALQNQPTWFAEGLAGYYESATVQDGLFVLGAPRRQHHARLSEEGILPTAKLFDSSESPTPRFYASAWLLVHYLMSRRADAFVRYQDELARGKNHAQAWAAAFPDLQQERLDNTLHEYYRAGLYDVFEADFSPAAVSVESAHLTRADEEALQGVLWHTCLGCADAVRAQKAHEHIQRALALDAHHVGARLLFAFVTDNEAERRGLFEAVIRDAPGDYRGWLGLASLLQGAEASAAVERALALAPNRASAWLARARYEWNIGNRVAALQSAERGLHLRPTSLPLLALYAEMLFLEGRCTEMSQIIRRASSVENASLDTSSVLRLEEIQQTCGSSAAP